MAKILVAITLLVCISATLALDLRQMIEKKAAGATPVRYSVESTNKEVAVAPADSKDDQETAASFYGYGYYGPGHGFHGYPGYGYYGHGYGYPFYGHYGYHHHHYGFPYYGGYYH